MKVRWLLIDTLEAQLDTEAARRLGAITLHLELNNCGKPCVVFLTRDLRLRHDVQARAILLRLYAGFPLSTA